MAHQPRLEIVEQNPMGNSLEGFRASHKSVCNSMRVSCTLNALDQPNLEDILLSLDPGRDDCLYRVRRVSGGVNRVVYVTITNLDIIPEEKRTHGPSVIKELSKLEEWRGNWTTLLCPYGRWPHQVRN